MLRGRLIGIAAHLGVRPARIVGQVDPLVGYHVAAGYILLLKAREPRQPATDTLAAQMRDIFSENANPTG